MFSVIIPIYNKEKYIKRTLDSVVNQNFKRFEIIIVDDGSTDSSMDIVKSYSDERIIIIPQKNKGVSTARNVGINNSTKDYIAFLDADDVWHPMYLQKIYELTQMYPKAGAYYTNYKVVKSNKIDGRYQKVNYSADREICQMMIEDYFDFAIKKVPIWTSAVVVKKDILKKFGAFPTNLTRGEDIFVWTKIALNNSIAYSNFIGSFYYKNAPTSLSKTVVPMEKSFAIVAEEFYLENVSTATNISSFREYMIRYISDKAKYLIRLNKNKDARDLLRKYADTKYNKKKVYVLYLLTFLPKPMARFFMNIIARS